MFLAPDGPYMATGEQPDTTRVRVQTYVPAYQREEWQRRADSMDMSLSEFVRTMTQAGKRGFDGNQGESRREESRRDPSSDCDPGGSRLEERVLSALSTDEYRDWDELVAAVQSDFEAELGESIDALVERGEIDHRHGKGYALA